MVAAIVAVLMPRAAAAQPTSASPFSLVLYLLAIRPDHIAGCEES